MSKLEFRLLIALAVLSWVITALVLVYNWDYIEQLVQRVAPTVPVVPPPDPSQGPAVEIPEVLIEWGEGDAGGAWLPLPRLDYALGPWQTQDGLVRASIASRSSPEAEASGTFWLQPYRIIIESEGRPTIVCGLYEGLNTDSSPLGHIPWRRGYCHAEESGARSQAARVHLLKQRGADSIRLVLGMGVDVELFQVP